MAGTYSFQDVTCTLTGGAVIDLGYGATVAEEGIEWDYDSERGSMTIGADGEGMHVLSANKSGTIKVRLLETSPVNAKLTALFNAEQLSSSAWGKSAITIQNSADGTTTVARQVAFKGLPGDGYSATGARVKEWVFNAIKIDTVRGVYEGA